MTQIRLAVSLALVAVAFSANAQQATRKPYIVQLVDAPAATYDGSVAGYAATRPAPGSKLNVNASNVQAYIAFLAAKQSSTVAMVPAATLNYRYSLALNGFSAWLTDAEVAKLAASASVTAITEDVPVPVDTSYTPKFLGINQPGGAWSKTDASGRLIKGEDVIIAHLDGGVWPEDPSFSDKVDASGFPVPSYSPGTVVYNPLPVGRYLGICQQGLGFTAAHCNNKLIGARYFNATLKSVIAGGSVTLWTGEYLDSPRDADGHGSHTLSTSGGNENAEAIVGSSSFRISGIAPRARVAAYKVCYVPQDAAGNKLPGTCFNGDSVAAIDAAVADRVDIINFSVGGSRTSVVDAVETAFRNASFAGVFVSASSGNSNVVPGNASTAAHVSPWLMTVGNSTHDRFTQATVTLGNGYTGVGTSFQTSGVPSSPLIYSRAAGVAGAPVTANLALCLGPADGIPAVLDPDSVRGKILVCERGTNVLVNKVANAKTAGAIAVIILNVSAANNTTPTISAVLPTVHLDFSNFTPLTTYMTANPTTATASIGPGIQVPGVIAPVMAGTSSRGPSQADLNILKPDITAPGTDIIAAYTNQSITPAQRQQIIDGTLVPGPGGEMISGTSMASPHVAGSAALLRQANPTWSPFAIKSALMTSATQNVKLADGTPDLDRWGYGAGHLNPNGALATKVVYDQTPADHLNYINGFLSGRDLNLASLTHANVVGIGTVTRKLTNKGTSPLTFTSAASLPGYTVTVSPPTLTIPAGGTGVYSVTMKRTTAALEQWAFGQVTWTDGTQIVYSPLTAKGSEFTAPALVTDARPVGTKVFTIGSGYDGNLLLSPTGLVPASRIGASINTGQLLCASFAYPSGGRVFRAQLFNSETQGGAASDLDLILQRQGSTGGFTTIASSGGATSDELISLVGMAAGNYRVCIDGFAPAGGSASFVLNTWIVGPAAGPQTLKAAGPAKVTTGGTASVVMSWTVQPGSRYLGIVDYRSVLGGPIIGNTSVFVDTTPAVAAAVQKGMEKVVRSKPEL